MYIVIGIIAALVLGPILIHIGNEKTNCTSNVTWELVIVLGVILILGAISVGIGIPAARSRVTDEIIEFEATRDTIENARTNNRDGWIERAALAPAMAEKNGWLAKEQADNKRWFLDIFTPDGVDNLEPLK